MEWLGGRRSTNVEDRRGMRVGPMALGGGLGSIALLLLGMLFGFDPRDILNTTAYDTSTPAVATDTTAYDERKDFVSAVVGYTEDSWSAIFRDHGRGYKPRFSGPAHALVQARFPIRHDRGMRYQQGETMTTKKNAAILSGIAAAFFLVRSLRKNQESAVMEQKVHELQDKFKSLDVEPAPV